MLCAGSGIATTTRSPINIMLGIVFFIGLVYIFIGGVVASLRGKYIRVPFISLLAGRYADRGKVAR